MKNRSLIKKALIALASGFAFITAIILLGSCNGFGKLGGGVDSTKGLKDFYADYFPIGVAVSPRSLEGEQGELIKKNFNSLTAENVMKPALIQPKKGEFNWADADKIVEFAQANGMKVRGHTLCWHAQTGQWMYQDSLGNLLPKEEALANLKDHITAVVSRYKGKVYGWDVLNEIVVDDTSAAKVYRESSPWYKVAGTDFIPLIYKWAHEADPDAILFYNDYNTENPIKRDKIYNMLKGLLDQGVPIHAVGLQAHWKLNDPTEENLRAAIDKFSSLGLDVQLTELDITVNMGRNDPDSTFTAEREQKQLEQYKMAFNVLRDNKKKITGVTFWNVSDRGSWLDRGGKKAYPLLFDENLKPKKAFWAVVDF
ncbi:MAG TPA: endo-1,4-beta-xylanase [Bacteroidales bacterium]|nr:endo-1,4-beta-xylanase [Bacteroidales bacterium]